MTKSHHLIAKPQIIPLLMALLLALFSTGVAAAGRVFLTFDDGPINVTHEILDVLKEQGVKATFFVNAIHLEGLGGENEDRSREALRRIVSEGHVLGNHSHDHMAHNRPPGVYSISAARAFRDIETDLPYFIPGNIAPINAALGELATRPNNQIDKLARLPFSNVWMLPNFDDLCEWCGSLSSPFWHPDARANADREVSNVAGQLAENLLHHHHMQSIGWDYQWMPSEWTLPNTNETMPPAATVERVVVSLLEGGQHCVPKGKGARCTSAVRPENVVLLTHDFLFENGPRGRGRDANLPQLVELISNLKARGYVFDTLDRYVQ